MVSNLAMSRSLKKEISNLTMNNFCLCTSLVRFKIESQVGIMVQLKVRQQVCEKIVICGRTFQRNQVLGFIKTQVRQVI